MIEIVPAIIPKDFESIKNRFVDLKSLVSKIQIDLSDGSYTNIKTWPFIESEDLDFRKILNKEIEFPFINDFLVEIDLLIKNPIQIIEQFIEIGAKSFIVHLDSTSNITDCINLIKKSNLNIGIGVKPSTNLENIKNYLNQIDFIQFMGNDIVGQNGIKIDTNIYEKINNFYTKNPETKIQIDIGVDEETIPKLKEVGVSMFISGSAIFNSEDIISNLKKFQNL